MSEYVLGMRYRENYIQNPVLEQVVDYAVNANSMMRRNGSGTLAVFEHATRQTTVIDPSRMTVDDLTRLYFSLLEDLPAMVQPDRFHVVRQPRRLVNPAHFWPMLADRYGREDTAEFFEEMWGQWGWLVDAIQRKMAEPKEVRLYAYRA